MDRIGKLLTQINNGVVDERIDCVEQKGLHEVWWCSDEDDDRIVARLETEYDAIAFLEGFHAYVSGAVDRSTDIVATVYFGPEPKCQIDHVDGGSLATVDTMIQVGAFRKGIDVANKVFE